jgi:hypothetical protein
MRKCCATAAVQKKGLGFLRCGGVDVYAKCLIPLLGESAPWCRIFDKFYRVRETIHKRSGTGLGLTICRGFVHAMGGTIVAGNRRDRTGSVFAITLPVPVIDR